MRRPSIAVLLVILLALPVCAQRWGYSGGHRGGGIAIGSRHGGLRIGGGVSFGHHPRWNVFIGSRPHYRVRPYYRVPYAYPYVYPLYPVPLYDTVGSYDYAVATPQPYVAPAPGYVISTPQPYLPYSADQQVGLDTQMRQQHVGIYRAPAQPPAETAPPEPAAAPAVPQPDQPLTVLVYRDGRHVQVHNYAIVGQTLWIFTEQRAEKVPLAELNLDATRKANDERGIDFAVPPAQ